MTAAKKFSIGATLTMIFGVLMVYCPFQLFSGKLALYGFDFYQLHQFRLDFAREALRAFHGLPGWYSREFFGTPFWANIDNFPWNPNRLVLLLVDSSFAYTFAVMLSAALAAMFSYLYARSIGLNQLAAAITGWTFSTAGFFSSRMMAGQLSVLEAYCALPMLLWIIECWTSESSSRMVALTAIATLFVALCGHPQIPAYAIGTAALYVIYRRKELPSSKVLLSMGTGLIMSLAVWWPMLKLILRSTRILPLAPSENDIVFPYSRLASFIFPWRDGWPPPVMRLPCKPFTGFPNDAYFWDTTNYIGTLPIAAFLLIVVYLILKKGRVAAPWKFIVAMSLLALITALPATRTLAHNFSWTIFRSPSRQLYVTTFGLSLCLGWLLQQIAMAQIKNKVVARTILSALVLCHVGELGHFARQFVRVVPRDPVDTSMIDKTLESNSGQYRVAIDFFARIKPNRRYDDIGFYDSITLAPTYKEILRLAGENPAKNVEDLLGSNLNSQMLSQLGVSYVITPKVRNDLTLQARESGLNLYSVPHPRPRAEFFSSSGASTAKPMAAMMERSSPDEIHLKIDAPTDGKIIILESWDDGWSAEVNNKPSMISKENGFMMAVPVAAGENNVRMIYRTPGKWLGLLFFALGLSSMLLLGRTTSCSSTRP